MTKSARFSLAPYLFSLPGLLFIAGFFLLPIAELMLASVIKRAPNATSASPPRSSAAMAGNRRC